MERVIEKIEFKGSNVRELQNAITRLTQAARIASNGQDWNGMEALHLQDEDGFSVTHLELIEETLSDRSKVYDVRMFFAVADFTQPDGLAKESDTWPELVARIRSAVRLGDALGLRDAKEKE